MPVECDVEVEDLINAVIADEFDVVAKSPCPDFQIPCPLIDVTNFTATLFGATFRWGANTSVGVRDRYRQRQITGGVPGPWSSWLPSVDGEHSDYDTVHLESDHRMSNKLADSLWDYQIQFTQEDSYSEIYPSCGLAVIRVQYPSKSGTGGGYDEEFIPGDL